MPSASSASNSAMWARMAWMRLSGGASISVTTMPAPGSEIQCSRFPDPPTKTPCSCGGP